LAGNERRAVRHLQLYSSIDVGAPDRNKESEGTVFAQRVLDSAEVTKRARLGTYESNYRCLLHIEAQSNVVERLFSRAKLIIPPERRNMNFFRLESLLFLQPITCCGMLIPSMKPCMMLELEVQLSEKA